MTIQHKPYPDWLYNAMPLIYLGMGVVATLVVPNLVGTLIGLSVLGVAVWIRFSRYHRTFAQSEEHMNPPTIFGKDDLSEGGLAQVSWHESLECGNSIIDDQHRRLFGLANEAIDSLLSKGHNSDEEALLMQLIEQLQTHFITEETMLARALAPGLEEHHAEHQALLAEARAMLKRFHDCEVISRDLVIFLSRNVITNHLIREDVSLVARLG